MTRFALGLPACGLGVVLALGGAGCGHEGRPDATTMRAAEMGGSSYLSEDAAVKALVDAGTVCAEMHDQLVRDVKARLSVAGLDV